MVAGLTDRLGQRYKVFGRTREVAASGRFILSPVRFVPRLCPPSCGQAWRSVVSAGNFPSTAAPTVFFLQTSASLFETRGGVRTGCGRRDRSCTMQRGLPWWVGRGPLFSHQGPGSSPPRNLGLFVCADNAINCYFFFTGTQLLKCSSFHP